MSPLAEYEFFEYKRFDEPTLSLHEAVEKATAMRKSDSEHVYRIVARDEGFIILKVPVAEVQAARFGTLIGRLLRWFPMATAGRRWVL